MKNLVIVESPTKARTIGRFLGKDYEIKASMGHVMDLPKSKLGVDVDHEFEPLFELISDKKKVVSDLKKTLKSAQSIILATDPDREGEAIAYHVAEILKIPKEKIKRMVFHEITKEAVEEALKNPRNINIDLVNAQTARRVLDRLVGYKLSPLLWQKVRRGLSAGRVQSIALRLIVQREREIERFSKEPYWTIQAKFRQHIGGTTPVPFDLVEIKGEKIELQNTIKLYDGDYKYTKTAVDSEQKAKELVQDIGTKKYFVSDVIQKETKRSPQAPYTTSTLQQDASRRFGMSGKMTMSIAQKLYEEGYITYHRTDSVAMAMSAVGAIRSYIKTQFGDKYVYQSQRFYSHKQKLAQEAHEAIRPTKVGVQMSEIRNQMGERHEKLYDLIWRRAVASQMSDALIESTSVLVDSDQKIRSNTSLYRFKANGSVLVFDGFLKINPQALQDIKLPQFIVHEEADLEALSDTAHETQSPPRYNDASLIKTLEEKGIGRPSTYASIVGTIQERGYIERQEGRFVPTAVGVAVNDFLVINFSDIDDIPFTAQMEDDLDAIANEKKDWRKMMKEFYEPFKKTLDKVKDSERVQIAVEETDEKCPKCGSMLVIRTGRFGKFLSCSTFPECDFRKSIVKDTGLICPKDGGKIIAKKTRKGRTFFGCSNYPNCDFAAWKLEDIKGGVVLKQKDEQTNKIIKAFSEDNNVYVLRGRYGPYIKFGKQNVRTPKDTEPSSLTYEQCKELAAKAAADPKAGKRKRFARRGVGKRN